MMAGFCLWLLKIDFTPVRMQMPRDTTVTVTSGYSNISFDRNRDKKYVQLLDALPDDNFYKINGSADGKQYVGKFDGKEYRQMSDVCDVGCDTDTLRLRCRSIRFLFEQSGGRYG